MTLATNSQNTESDDARCNYHSSRVKARSLARRRRLTVLTRLILHESDEITDDGVQYCIVSLSPLLEHLDLGKCSNLSGTRMTTTTAPSLQRLRYLDLSECTEFTDAGLLHVGSMHRLGGLDLHGCRNITDSGLSDLSSLHHLMHLNIWGCRKVTDVGLAYLAPLTHLQILNIRLCDQVTDIGMIYVASMLQLQHLNLSGCHRITDDGIVRMIPLVHLQTLNLRLCDKITDVGLRSLVTKLPRLRHINLWACTSLSYAGVTALTSANRSHVLDIEW